MPYKTSQGLTHLWAPWPPSLHGLPVNPYTLIHNDEALRPRPLGPALKGQQKESQCNRLNKLRATCMQHAQHATGTQENRILRAEPQEPEGLCKAPPKDFEDFAKCHAL